MILPSPSAHFIVRVYFVEMEKMALETLTKVRKSTLSGLVHMLCHCILPCDNAGIVSRFTYRMYLLSFMYTNGVCKRNLKGEGRRGQTACFGLRS